MYKPPQRIKYVAAPGQWPSAEQAAKATLFQPIQVGSVTLTSRTWVPAMVPWRAQPDGEVSDDVLSWYERFAQGKPAVIVVEATGIRDIPSGPLLRIGHPRFVSGLRELVQTVHAASDGQTRLFIQLIDFLTIRRRPAIDTFFQRFFVIDDALRGRMAEHCKDDNTLLETLINADESDHRELLSPRDFESLYYGYRERVTDMHFDHIRELPAVLPGMFAGAAQHAQEAGFDGVELHYAHAYTMASFLSKVNQRDDGYGGSRDNRVRLGIEVFNAVRDHVTDAYPVGCRFLADECIDEGSGVDDACFFGQQFAAAGMDFLSLSRGGKFDDAKRPKAGQAIYPYTGPSGYECMPGYLSDEFGPFGRNIEATAQIKQSLRDASFDVPVVMGGGLHGFSQCEAILKRGDADIIAAARQSLADPDWFEKMRQGRGDEIRNCEYTNYCEGLDQKHKQVTCQLWDRTDRDAPNTPMSKDGKRRLIAPPWQ